MCCAALQVYKVMFDGVQPYAAKVLQLSLDSDMEDTFLQVSDWD